MTHEPTDGKLSLKIHSRADELAGVRREVERFVASAGCDESETSRVVLAVDEALTNVIRHAYNEQPDGEIDIDMQKDARRLHIVIRDYGRSVDPSNIRSRDLDDIRPGGLGVHIITECMDSVTYQPAADGGTVLTLEKSIHPTSS
jgi:anti-sigma regulatory factor (Ser/Thr protein kinase)